MIQRIPVAVLMKKRGCERNDMLEDSHLKDVSSRCCSESRTTLMFYLLLIHPLKLADHFLDPWSTRFNGSHNLFAVSANSSLRPRELSRCKEHALEYALRNPSRSFLAI
mmetsp:Transcript_432/g.781  ORF Transcript_432/g.781 Transcript_432/m.781 type:complete len:109 (-) Transcript_432:1437-1763(-)